jgi:hypothetical protein
MNLTVTVIDVRLKNATIYSLSQGLENIAAIDGFTDYSTEYEARADTLIRQAFSGNQNAVQSIKLLITQILADVKEEAQSAVAKAEKLLAKARSVIDFTRKSPDDVRSQILGSSGNVEDLVKKLSDGCIETIEERIRTLNSRLSDDAAVNTSTDTADTTVDTSADTGVYTVVEQIRVLTTESSALLGTLDSDIANIINETSETIRANANELISRLKDSIEQMLLIMKPDNGSRTRINYTSKLIGIIENKITQLDRTEIIKLINILTSMLPEIKLSLVNVFKERISQLGTIENALRQKQSIVAVVTPGDVQAEGAVQTAIFEACRRLEKFKQDTNPITIVKRLIAIIKDKNLKAEEFKDQIKVLIEEFTDQISALERNIMQDVDNAIALLARREKEFTTRAALALNEAVHQAIELLCKTSERNTRRGEVQAIIEEEKKVERIAQDAVNLSTVPLKEQIRKAQSAILRVTELTERMNTAINLLMQEEKEILMQTLNATIAQAESLWNIVTDRDVHRRSVQKVIEWARRVKREVNSATDSSTKTLQQQIEELKRVIQSISDAMISLMMEEKADALLAVVELNDTATEAERLIPMLSVGNRQRENALTAIRNARSEAEGIRDVANSSVGPLKQKIQRAQGVKRQATDATRTISTAINSLVQEEKDFARGAVQRLNREVIQLRELLIVASGENRQNENARTTLDSTRQSANNVMHLSGGSPSKQIQEAKTATRDAMQKISDIGSVAVELVRAEKDVLTLELQNANDLDTRIHNIMNLFKNRKIKSQLESAQRLLHTVRMRGAQFLTSIASVAPDHQGKKQQITTAKEITEQIIRAVGIAQDIQELVSKRTRDFKFAFAFVVFLIPAITSGIIVACLPLGAIGTNFMLSNSIMMSLHIANACKIGIAVLMLGALAFVGFMLAQRKINNLTNQIQNHKLPQEEQEEIKTADIQEESVLRDSRDELEFT